jgi:hypothetical protein
LLGKRSKRWLFLCKRFPIRFLATDFNTGTITVTLQISLHYSTQNLQFTYLRLHRPTSNSCSCMNFLWRSPTEKRLTGSADCLQDNSTARTPRKTPSFSVKDACLQLRCLATGILLFRAFAWHGLHRKQLPLYCCYILKGVFTGHCIATAVLLLLPVFIAVRMFTDIPLQLPNLAKDCLDLYSWKLDYQPVTWQCGDMSQYVYLKLFSS